MNIFSFAPQLAQPPRVTFSHQTYIERLRTGGEVRSQHSSHFLREWTVDFILEKTEAQKAREFFDKNEEALIKFPDWVQPAQSDGNGKLTKYDHIDLACSELYLVDKSDESWQIVERANDLSTQVVKPHQYVYAVRIGRIKKIPQFPSFGDDKVRFTCTFSEDVSSRNFEHSVALLDQAPSFKGRKVFPFYYKDLAESWQNNVAFSKRGFGVETSYKRETFPKREITLSVHQSGRDEVRALIDFYDARKGRAGGFWLSTGRANFQLAEAAKQGDTTLTLDAPFPQVRDGVNYIELRTFGCASEYHKITSVDGNKVTLEEALEHDRSTDTAVSFLYSVRFSSDTLTLDYENDQIVRSQLKFVELMAEYDEAQEARTPRYVYEFSGFYSDNVTSYGRSFSHNETSYTPANISHDKISYKEQSIRSSCNVSFTPEDENHPLYAFRNGLPLEQIRVRISKIEGATKSFLYEANVRSAQYGAQREIKLSLGSFADVADSELPAAYFESRCSRQFLREGCNLAQAAFSITSTVNSVLEELVTVDAAETEATTRGFADWFQNGQVIIGDERRTVLSQQGKQLLVSTPFIKAQAGDSVTLVAGCNRTSKQCINRFDNYVNFGGTPYVPTSNPQLEAVRVNSKIPQGGKK